MYSVFLPYFNPSWGDHACVVGAAPVAMMPKKGLSLGKKPQATSEMLSDIFGPSLPVYSR